MYYKIENKDSKVYKELHALRTKELQIEKDNQSAIEEKTGMSFQRFYGTNTQQSFGRVCRYSGFGFIEKERIDPKIWKEHKGDSDISIPNTRTKLGREMKDFISHELGNSSYQTIFDILKINEGSRFTLPFLEISKEFVLLFLDENHVPKDENVIEITKKEFELLFKD